MSKWRKGMRGRKVAQEPVSAKMQELVWNYLRIEFFFLVFLNYFLVFVLVIRRNFDFTSHFRNF